MTDPVALKTVHDFALKSESDLKTALIVAAAVPGMKEQITSDFLQALQQKLSQKKPKGWEVTQGIPNVYGERYSGVSIWQAEWTDNYSIRLEAQEWGKGSVLGVWRNWNKLRGGPNPDVLDQFRDAKWPGKANRWWEWYVRVPNEYGDWHDTEALVKMKFKTGETVEYLVSAMLKAAKLGTPLLNEMTKSKPIGLSIRHVYIKPKTGS
ncbi:MAG TPA: hypothetical protein VEH27_12020 [Methylomirabilota bacterium]|nr:hypothetical protein [Methylomirabilota bacterium]